MYLIYIRILLLVTRIFPFAKTLAYLATTFLITMTYKIVVWMKRERDKNICMDKMFENPDREGKHCKRSQIAAIGRDDGESG